MSIFHATALLVTTILLSVAVLPGDRVVTLKPLQRNSVYRIIDGIAFRNYSFSYDGITQHSVWCMDYSNNNSNNNYQDNNNYQGNSSIYQANNIGSDPKQQLQCIPSVLIAGTQKSGTTVLAALLSEHPKVSFSLQKEVHFFDVDRNYNKGIAYYLKHFRPLDVVTSNTNNNKGGGIQLPIVAEATPFYIASRQSCSRIAELHPGMKLIVLLREPVARAYSEYQMKKRRVDKQSDFLRSIHRLKKEVYRCMLRSHPPHNLLDIARCVPGELSSHALWHKLATAWRRSLVYYNGDWDAVVRSCFRLIDGSPRSAATAMGMDGTANTAMDIGDEGRWDTLDSTSFLCNTSSIVDVDYRRCDTYSDCFHRSKHAPLTHHHHQYHHHHHQLEFLELSCWNQSRSLYEYLLPVEHALVDEAEAFQQCSQKLAPTSGTEAGGDDSHRDDRNHRISLTRLISSPRLLVR
jgi:hypothetical protein